MPAPLLRDLIETWQAARFDPDALQRLDPVALASDAVAMGHPTLACEILRICGVDESGSAQARYLAALAHAKVGASGRALAMAVSLLDDPDAASLHGEALALAGRIAKDRWSRLPEGEAREHAGKRAVDCYRRAWREGRDIFPGINAATMLMLTGAQDEALALAREVRERGGSDDLTAAHWREATLGEAALLMGDAPVALTHYRAAVHAAGRHVGHIASMRRQLRLLARVLPVPTELQAALDVPRIVVFTGHMIDAPRRETPRFPAAIESPIAAQLSARLDAVGAGFGYCSAACGADILFIEAMLARGAEVHVTLPFERRDFIATSVAFAGRAWVERFERALAGATSVSYGVNERFLGDESLYGYAGSLILGAALLRARELETEPVLLAVVDHDAELLAGGTREMIEHWMRLGLAIERIDPAPLRTELATNDRKIEFDAPPIEIRANALRRHVRTMLFADVVGFSRMGEEDTPSFLVHFLGAIAEIIAHLVQKPTFVNTWGDGLFMVFDNVRDGAEFALGLRDAVLYTDWKGRGLPATTSLRIGMHTGPVFEAMDPLIGRRNYFGSHVVRAARIEPVAVPGSIYVSAELAFSLAASAAKDFATDYLGVLPLAKSYGSGPLYRLRRSDEAE